MEDRSGSRPKVMSVEELLAAEPELPTEDLPAEWSDTAELYAEGDRPDLSQLDVRDLAPGQWAIGGDGVRQRVAGIERGRLDPHAVAREVGDVDRTDAAHPPWLAKLYLSQVRDVARRQVISPDTPDMRPLSIGFPSPEGMVDSFPTCAIGKVDFSNGKSGTGALVGRRILLTCSHGVPWDQDPSSSLRI